MLSKKYLPKLPESPTRKGGEEGQPGAERSEGTKFFEEEAPPGRAGFFTATPANDWVFNTNDSAWQILHRFLRSGTVTALTCAMPEWRNRQTQGT